MYSKDSCVLNWHKAKIEQLLQTQGINSVHVKNATLRGLCVQWFQESLAVDLFPDPASHLQLTHSHWIWVSLLK